MLSIFTDWIIKVYKSIYFPQDVFLELQKIEDASEQINESLAFQTLSAIILTFGISMMLIYFFMKLAERSAANELGIKQLFIAFIELIFVAIIMSSSQHIIDGMLNFGNALKETIVNADSNAFEECWFDLATVYEIEEGKNVAIDNSVALKESIGEIGSMKAIMYIIKLIPPYIIALVTDVVFFIIMISRSVEMGIRSLFCPMAIADAFDDRRKSNAVRYMKKMLALVIQFAVAVAIILAFNAMVQSLSPELPEPSETFQLEVEHRGVKAMIVDSVRRIWGGDTGGELQFESTSGGVISNIMNFFSNMFFLGSGTHIMHSNMLEKTLVLDYTCTNMDGIHEFLNCLLGGADYWIFLALSIAKIVMLIKSQALAKDIVGE